MCRVLTLLSLDLLTEDYATAIILKCKKNAGPVAVTIETVQGDGGSLTSKVSAKYSFAKFNLDKGQLTADGARSLETSLDLTPEIKLSFKANKGADLCVDYTKGNFLATGVLDVMDMSKLTTSACLGLPSSGLKVGGDATYGLSGAGLTNFSLGASYGAGPLFASVTATSKLSTFNIGLLYKVNSDLSLASQTTHSSEKICDVLAIGGAYSAPIGTIKAKMGSNGILHASLIKDIAPKVTLTASGSVSPSDLSSFKPGISISM